MIAIKLLSNTYVLDDRTQCYNKTMIYILLYAPDICAPHHFIQFIHLLNELNEVVE